MTGFSSVKHCYYVVIVCSCLDRVEHRHVYIQARRLRGKDGEEAERERQRRQRQRGGREGERQRGGREGKTEEAETERRQLSLIHISEPTRRA